MPIETKLMAGLDLGQASDASAFVVMEVARWRQDESPIQVEEGPPEECWE